MSIRSATAAAVTLALATSTSPLYQPLLRAPWDSKLSMSTVGPNSLHLSQVRMDMLGYRLIPDHLSQRLGLFTRLGGILMDNWALATWSRDMCPPACRLCDKLKSFGSSAGLNTLSRFLVSCR